MKRLLGTGLAALFLLTPAANAGEAEVSLGKLGGTLATHDTKASGKGVVIVAGSGPTDRNGNNRLGVGANALKMLSDALAADGVSVLGYDKRGVGASKALVTDEAALRFKNLVDDASGWATCLDARPGVSCVFMLGHGEGGSIATHAAARTPLAGLLLIASPGRPLSARLRDQFARNIHDDAMRAKAVKVLESLEAGKTVPDIDPKLSPFFRPGTQPYMMSALAIDPAKALAAVKIPVLIVSGGRDLQVIAADFEALKAARPNANAVRIVTMNHVLKNVSEGRTPNFESYRDPKMPLSPELVQAVRGFVGRTACPG
jgi:pimeloyl-ACP methyl ester carboxylesterase